MQIRIIFAKRPQHLAPSTKAVAADIRKLAELRSERHQQ